MNPGVKDSFRFEDDLTKIINGKRAERDQFKATWPSQLEGIYRVLEHAASVFRGNGYGDSIARKDNEDALLSVKGRVLTFKADHSRKLVECHSPASELQVFTLEQMGPGVVGKLVKDFARAIL